MFQHRISTGAIAASFHGAYLHALGTLDRKRCIYPRGTPFAGASGGFFAFSAG